MVMSNSSSKSETYLSSTEYDDEVKINTSEMSLKFTSISSSVDEDNSGLYLDSIEKLKAVQYDICFDTQVDHVQKAVLKEDIHFKCEEDRSLKSNNNNKIEAKQRRKVFICDFKTTHGGALRKHMAVHNRQSANMLYCNNCSYKTLHKGFLLRHLKTHIKVGRYACKICTRRFFCKSELDSHLFNGHNGETSNTGEILNVKPYSCASCIKRYTRKDQLMLHIIRTHDVGKSNSYTDKTYKCAICAYKTTRASHFSEHIMIHKKRSITPRFKCEKCEYKTWRKSYLNHHSRIHLNEKRFKCGTCKMGFNLKSGLNNHVLKSHDNEISDMREAITSTIHRCRFCLYQTIRVSNLTRHMVSNHPDNLSNLSKFSCGDCNYKTYLRGNLFRHSHIHSTVKRLACRWCKQGFSQKQQLDSHILHKHQDEIRNSNHNVTSKVYKCQECPFETLYSSHMTSHVLTHSNTRKLACDKCGYRTRLKHNLLRHSLSHLNEKRFICAACNKGFMQKSNLDLHILKKHEGKINNSIHKLTSKIHKCQFCPYQTNQSNNLSRHVATHKNTNKQKWKCDKCDYQTSQKSDLVLHSHVHLCAKPFVCTVCNKGFIRKLNLDMHLLKKHRGEVSEGN